MENPDFQQARTRILTAEERIAMDPDGRIRVSRSGGHAGALIIEKVIVPAEDEEVASVTQEVDKKES